MAEGQEADKSEMELQQLLLMPPADEQRAIICSLESDTADESLHVYTVSQAWYDHWRAYVGLEQVAQQRSDAGEDVGSAGTASQGAMVSYSPSTKTTTDDCATKTAATSKRSTSSETCRHGKELNTENKPAALPGPIEMDLTDEDNISVDEKVYTD